MNDKLKIAPLKIAAFFDGRPGHEKQTKGILAKLADLTPLEIHATMLPAPTLWGSCLNWIKYIAGYRFNMDVKGFSYPPGDIDIIIGTGSRTHIPMLMHKKQCNAKAVTCMSPSSILIRHLDLCFIPQHDNPKPFDHVFLTVGPPNTSLYSEKKEKGRGLILIGGIDEKSHHWHSQKTISQVKEILQKEQTTQWTISSSPRTPEELTKELSDMIKKYSNASFSGLRRRLQGGSKSNMQKVVMYG